MAEKNTTELERIYTIPLRKTKDLVRSRRADLAVRDVKRFLTRHMKSEDIWLDQEVNQLLWARGKFTIPSRIRVRATRFSDGVVEVTLPESEHTGSVRTEIAQRREKAAESPVLKAPAAEEGGEEGHAAAPVTEVKGIGPATAEKLDKAGITTVGELAKADPADVAEATGSSTDKAKAWIDAAKELASHAHEGGEEGEAKAEPAAEGDKPAAEGVSAPGKDDAGKSA
jgi:large subunit ribosomal protein L31e